MKRLLFAIAIVNLLLVVAGMGLVYFAATYPFAPG